MYSKTLNINSQSDFLPIINQVKSITVELGFDKTTQARLATAVSEIITNVIKHADKGACTLNYDKDELGGIEIIVSDNGPGIEDIEKAVKGGQSTFKGSLGVGLAGAKRLVEEFDIQSSPGKGTRVILREFLPASFGRFEHGGASLSKPGEVFNGDGYFIKKISRNKLFIALIDGGGHGLRAKEKTGLVLKYLENHFQEPLKKIVKECNNLLIDKEKQDGREKCLVLGLCLISSDRFSYLGIGDTGIKVIEPTNQIHPVSKQGVLGFSKQLPVLKKQEYPFLGESVIIMYSDGIIGRFDKKEISFNKSAQKMAESIVQNCKRGQDDATVVVVKKKNKQASGKISSRQDLNYNTNQQLQNIKFSSEEEKKKTWKLKEIKDFLFSVIANAPIGIITINMSKIITVCNAEVLWVLDKNMDPEEVINQPINVFLNDLPLFLKAMDKAYQKSRQSFNMPVVFYRERYLSIRARKVSDGMLIFIDNITDLVQTKSSLEQQKEIDRMKTEFLSVAAHQLKTPLGSMRWNMEMLLAGDLGNLPQPIKETIQQIYESNKRMINLVNHLLNVSRIEQKGVFNKPKLTDILELIKKSIAEIKIAAEKKSISISLLVDKNLSQITIDPDRFREVVQNLLSNAVKFNYPGGRVVIEVKCLTEYLQISIRDTGMGIPKRDQTRVFSKFFRAVNAIKSESKGSGLGLFVIKSYVESWRGKVWFESEENKGTTFYFTVPIK